VLSEYRVASFKHLLDNGLSVNHKFECGKILLHWLCVLKDNERLVPLARLLLERGADIEATDTMDWFTALQAAIYNNSLRIAALLLAHGADLDARNNSGRTPLHVASTLFICTDSDSAKLLLEYGADVNAIDFDERTPLHLVSRGLTGPSYGLFMAEVLLENGADVNAISNNGCSPPQEAI
jgi:ankyrin repeat protein